MGRMRFIVDGAAYDSADLIQHEPDDPLVPLIYATPDGRDFFVVRMREFSGVNVERADVAEIRRLAGKYGLTHLLKAVNHRE